MIPRGFEFFGADDADAGAAEACLDVKHFHCDTVSDARAYLYALADVSE